MKKNEKSSKAKKEEAKKEPNKESKKGAVKKGKHVVTLKGLKDIGKVPAEREKAETAPKKIIKEKSTEPKAPKSKPLKSKIPENIETYVREETQKGKRPMDLILPVMEMFDKIKKVDNEKAAQKRAEWTIWRVRHEMGVTRKPKS